MDTATATAPNTVEYRTTVADAATIRASLVEFPNLPLEAKAALEARVEELEAKAARLHAEHAATAPAAQRAYSAGLSRTYLA